VFRDTPSANLKLLVIWEPILRTDWGRPGAGVLSRASDRRASQFWDRDHLFANQLKHDLEAAHAGPICCEQDGILWDLVAVYPEQVRWEKSLPKPAYIYGPGVDSAELPGVLGELLGGKQSPRP
jgi:hypothetical protein